MFGGRQGAAVLHSSRYSSHGRQALFCSRYCTGMKETWIEHAQVACRWALQHIACNSMASKSTPSYRKSRSKPIGRILLRRAQLPAIVMTAIPLGRELLHGSSFLPARSASNINACLFGIAPSGGYRVSPFVTQGAAFALPGPKDSSLWPCSSPYTLRLSADGR